MAASEADGDRRLALIGFGEASTTLLSGWTIDPAMVAAYDVKIDSPQSQAEMASRYEALGVAGSRSAGEAVARADIVVSLVTADQAVAAAAAAAPHLKSGALYIDGNSCSPGSKRRAAAAIGAAGGRYVDMAIMAPVAPRRERTPVLLAGRDAAEAKRRLEALGMLPSIAGAEIGEASTIKMLRSVMIKGFEALPGEACWRPAGPASRKGCWRRCRRAIPASTGARGRATISSA